MTDELTGTQIHELVDRIETLESRVAELEQADDETPTEPNEPGVDHRDATVLERIQQDGYNGPRSIVGLYLNYTDIARRETAVRRAKQLQNKEAFKQAVENE
jgi:hypothetical protein